MASALEALPNIGKVVAGQLAAVGIATPDDLRAAGSREAWLRLRAGGYDPCLSCLQGLEGAVRGVRWHHLDNDVKDGLKTFFKENA